MNGGNERNSNMVSVRKSEVTRPLKIARPRREDNTTADLTQIWWAAMGWIPLVLERAQWRRIVNAVLNIRVS
jgi:hypothetical protein